MGRSGISSQLRKLWTDDTGASAAEYALILAIVGSAISLAALVLGDSISGEMVEAATVIDGSAAPADGQNGGGGNPGNPGGGNPGNPGGGNPGNPGGGNPGNPGGGNPGNPGGGNPGNPKGNK